MSSDLRKDLAASFAVINYAAAELQGKFAELTILAQIGVRDIDQDEISKTREKLSRVAAWSNDLWNKRPIIAASWTSAETFDAMKSLELLRNAKEDLLRLLAPLTRALESVRQGDIESAQTLVGAFGRFAYARENYIRGFIEYGKRMVLPQISQNYEQILPSATADLENASNLLTTLRDAAQIDGRFLSQLAERCRNLPSIFLTHVHDINLLLAQFNGGISYDTLEFNKREADAWRLVGAVPQAAGYWRAYNFTPEEAAEWASVGLTDVPLAHDWRSSGFSAQSSAQWLPLEIPAGLAQLWDAAGYDAAKALEFLQRGQMEPPKK